jgi:hypothetical protein
LGVSLEKVDGSPGCKDSSERRAAVGCGRSDSLIASVSSIVLLCSLKIEGRADGNGSESLNETGGSGIDVMDEEEISSSGADSG